MFTKTIMAALFGGLLVVTGCTHAPEPIYNTPEVVITPPEAADMIRNVNIEPGQTVTSPLTVTGEARGTWYFEADFPVRLQDANGNELAVGIAQAEGEWMTEDFVPFSTTFTFGESDTDTGWLVLERDNPSGLPEHAASYSIPVRFR